MMEISSSPAFRHLLCSTSEFQILDFIQQGASPISFFHLIVSPLDPSGGSGKVYSGYWNKKKKKVALKFFGYSISEPREEDILNEIRILQQLQHIPGFVQVEAVFFDSASGKADNKIHLSSYPCIVMELLEGKELIEVVDQRRHISELDLATIFRQLIHTLYQCHDIGFIHRSVNPLFTRCPHPPSPLRDLKLQNLMFADKDSLTSCKIIDCGMMVQLPPKETIYTSPKIQGTMGYVAPESLTKRQYSSASDIWQAGVCLYSLLSGSYPFNPRYPEHVVERGFVPMVGLGWKNISDNAKDLVSQMLVKDPADRISMAQIFKHPCQSLPLSTVAPDLFSLLPSLSLGLQINGATDDALGPAYTVRLKQLLLRQKLKEFFVESDLEQTIATQRENLLEVAPILKKFTRQRQRKQKATASPGHPSPLSAHRKSVKKILPVDLDLDQQDGVPLPPGSPSKPPLPHLHVTTPPTSQHTNSSPHTPSMQQSPAIKLLRTPSRFSRGSSSMSPMRPHNQQHGSSSASTSGSGSNSYEKMKEFNIKLNQLKSVVIHWVQRVKTSFQMTSSSSRGSPGSAYHSSSGSMFHHPSNSLDYESFERILLECGLEEIAKPEVFSIFDIEKCGEIKLRDFLLTLQAFKPVQEVYDEEGRLDSARFYFRLFDLNEIGSIDLEDLKIVISCLVLNDLPMLSPSSPGASFRDSDTPPPSPMSPMSPPTARGAAGEGGGGRGGTVRGSLSSNETSDSLTATAHSVSDLFSLINISRDGRIDFEEFRVFYDAILAYTNTRHSLVSYETEATRKIDQVIFEDQFRCFGFDL
jgi:serine/threonine protein kinase